MLSFEGLECSPGKKGILEERVASRAMLGINGVTSVCLVTDVRVLASTAHLKDVGCAETWPCLHLRPQLRPGENQRGKGEGPLEGERGRVPGRTCRRSGCCGFPEVLGLFRAELYRTNIELGELKMTAWSFQTSQTEWDPVTRSGS